MGRPSELLCKIVCVGGYNFDLFCTLLCIPYLITIFVNDVSMIDSAQYIAAFLRLTLQARRWLCVK